jgi:sugar diacid utilization regulator
MVIKANTITLKNLLEASTKEGDFLQTQRMLISSADAWGSLSRDLIMALGIERAKRFLIRYGYQCGMHEAKMLKELFEWENEKEWVLGGVTMHNISGRASSVPTKVNIDTDNGVLDVEGYWNNSYEAKQYLQYFPPHYESVCYFLIGYAGGYCSTSLGKKVVFKEVECIGKGDKHCRFIGKTLEAWGDEITSDLIDYEQADISNELDRAYKRIERQGEILHRGTAISNQLTQIVLQGKGLDAIAKTLGENLQCDIFIYNQHFETIVEHGKMSTYSLKNIIENMKELQPSISKNNEQVTIQLNNPDEQEIVHHQLITPIIVRNQISGYVSLVKTSGEFEELDPSFIERAANICAIHILNEQKAIETEYRMKSELLEEILRQPNQDFHVAKRLSYLGYNLNKPHYVFVFQLQNQNIHIEDDDSLTTARNLIVDILAKQASQVRENILVSNRLVQVHALIPEELLVKRKLKIAQYGEQLLGEIIRNIPSLQILVGISNRCLDINGFHQGFKQASKAIEIAKIRGRQQRVLQFSELGHMSILLDARKPEELESYANETLGPISDYDAQYSTELLKTLYFYLNNECNLHKTARIMNISIGGMRYRLTRINELFDIDLTNSSTRLEVQLSLDIYLALGKTILIE